jgi:Ca2+-binding RTX toxin-like protein
MKRKLLLTAAAVTAAAAALAGPASANVTVLDNGSRVDVVSDSADFIGVTCGDDRLIVNGVVRAARCPDIEQLVVRGGPGANVIDLSGLGSLLAAGAVLVDGAAGADRITGGAKIESIRGGTGADVVTAGGGDDTMIWRVGDGNDTFRGGAGDDTLTFVTTDIDEPVDIAPADRGGVTARRSFNPETASAEEVERVEALTGAGDDTIAIAGGLPAGLIVGVDAGFGDDRVRAGAGVQEVVGGSGDDDIDAGADVDSVDAGEGNDTVEATDGLRELVRCGSEDDVVRVDAADSLLGCETVTRVDPPPPPPPPPPAPAPTPAPAPPVVVPSPPAGPAGPAAPSAPAPAPRPPARPTPPRLALAGGAVQVRNGVANVRASCTPASRRGTCRARLTLRAGRTAVGAATAQLPAGRATVVRVRLTRAGADLLRRAPSVQTTGTLNATDAAGARASRTVRITLRRPSGGRLQLAAEA